MEDKEDKIEKVFYTISEVAEMLSVGTAALRFYEDKFQLKIGRRSGRKLSKRVYTIKCIVKLKYIVYLLRDQGYTIKGAIMKYQTTTTNDNSRFKGMGFQTPP